MVATVNCLPGGEPTLRAFNLHGWPVIEMESRKMRAGWKFKGAASVPGKNVSCDVARFDVRSNNGSNGRSR